jgi:hypothetical protein
MPEIKPDNNKNTQETISQKIQSFSGILMVVVTLGNILIGVLNFGIASKLEPVASDLRLVTSRVNALEQESDKHINDDEFAVFTKDLHARLDRIENKLDRYIEK